MSNEVTEGKNAARELAARLPGWSVWYGRHTGRFWAMPRTATPGGPQLAEGGTPEELEDAVHRITGGAPRQTVQDDRRPEQQTPMDPQYLREPVTTRN